MQQLGGLAAKRQEASERRRRLEEMVKPAVTELEEGRADLETKEAALEELQKAKPPDTAAIAKVESEIEALKDAILGLARIEGEWNRLKGQFDALLSTWDAYQKVLTEGKADKPSPVEGLAAVDLLQSQGDADRLHIEVSSSGGEVHLTKSV